MNKTRLEAFSDGVVAILITIMVLDLKVPHEVSFACLVPMAPVFLSYVLSFIYLGIYWSNHHHLMQAVHTVNGRVLWANLHLLFWLSLVPFASAWMGENHFMPIPVALYGVILIAAACAYTILVQVLIATEGKNSLLARAVGKDFKGYLSLAIYTLAVAIAYKFPTAACLLYAGVAAMWLVPDRRIEKVILQTAE